MRHLENAPRHQDAKTGNTYIQVQAEDREQPQGWQPIETAPKDGTAILLWWPYWSSSRAIVGWWAPRQPDLGWSAWESSYQGNCPGPTHWMPLPEPPTEELTEAERQFVNAISPPEEEDE